MQNNKLLVKEMLRATPRFTLPLHNLETIVSLVDSYTSVKVPSSILYYHLLAINEQSQ